MDSDILNGFETISLEEMGNVRLMNRIDTKYVTTLDKLRALLSAASSGYLVQQIDGRTVMPYYTRYYDTPEVDMYYEHQRGKKTRQKVRVRRYEGSDTPPFIEVKSKNNKGRCRKKRVEMDNGTAPADYGAFLERHTAYEASALEPRIENHFYRITLVNKAMTERVTIDTDLEFHNLTNDNRVSMNHIAVIEWKRDGRSDKSELGAILRDLRIRPTGFSKYCIGMAVTDPDLKQNRLKKKIRRIDKISRK